MKSRIKARIEKLMDAESKVSGKTTLSVPNVDECENASVQNERIQSRTLQPTMRVVALCFCNSGRLFMAIEYPASSYLLL